MDFKPIIVIPIFFVTGWCLCVLFGFLTFMGVVPVGAIFGTAAVTMIGTVLLLAITIVWGACFSSENNTRGPVLEAPVTAQPVIVVNGGNSSWPAQAPVYSLQGLQPPTSPVAPYEQEAPPSYNESSGPLVHEIPL